MRSSARSRFVNFVNECIALINDYLATGYITQKDVTAILKKEVKFDMRGGEEENRKKVVPIWEKVTLTLEEAAAYSNVASTG